ncbi:HpcH/HpaI aldolase/citrate lyase family protein [Parasphingorhabdus halotolerans]|nr:CoA ester lyase [Parasphingorhabdus halotolerans]
MPASNERALEKAKTLSADTIIFDLEDAVAPDAKSDAREGAFDAVGSGDYGARELVVRINGMDTPWFTHDMKRMCASGAHAILVPKVTSAKDIASLTDFMENEEAHLEKKLWVMIEMPLAVINIAEIASMSEHKRLSTLVMGFNDLAKEMRAEQDRTLFTPAMAQSIMAARAHSLNIIDSVYNDFNDPDGLAVECEQARKYGFDGKTLIHPSQIEIANAAFSPSAEKIAEAAAIIAAFADPVNAGKGVITVDGKMTEILHLKQAKQTVAIAEAIASHGA